MTKTNFLRGSSSDSCIPRQAGCAHCVFVRSKEVCTLCTPLCTAGFLTCVGSPPSWAPPSPVHAGLCCRRHDFAAQTVVVGGSGFSGNVFGSNCGLASDPSTESRCVGSGLSSGPFWFWLIRPTLTPRDGNAAHVPLRRAHTGVEFRPGRMGRGGGGLAPERPAVVVRFAMTARLRGFEAPGPEGPVFVHVPAGDHSGADHEVAEPG